ncbi:MAG: ABC transporter substrate-binding protein [Saprospiraceae bacterium]
MEAAKQLLADAGWKDTNQNGIVDKNINGEQVEMDLEYLATPGSRFANTVAEILKDNAAQVGINVRITPREFRAMLGEEVARREYQLYAGAAASYQLPDDFFPVLHTASNTARGQNRTQFGTPETDALIEKIQTTMDVAQRDKLYKSFQRIVYDEQPMIFLLSPQERLVISKRFKPQLSSLSPNFVVRNFVHLQK